MENGWQPRTVQHPLVSCIYIKQNISSKCPKCFCNILQCHYFTSFFVIFYFNHSQFSFYIITMAILIFISMFYVINFIISLWNLFLCYVYFIVLSKKMTEYLSNFAIILRRFLMMTPVPLHFSVTKEGVWQLGKKK